MESDIAMLWALALTANLVIWGVSWIEKHPDGLVDRVTTWLWEPVKEAARGGLERVGLIRR